MVGKEAVEEITATIQGVEEAVNTIVPGAIPGVGSMIPGGGAVGGGGPTPITMPDGSTMFWDPSMGWMNGSAGFFGGAGGAGAGEATMSQTKTQRSKAKNRGRRRGRGRRKAKKKKKEEEEEAEEEEEENEEESEDEDSEESEDKDDEDSEDSEMEEEEADPAEMEEEESQSKTKRTAQRIQRIKSSPKRHPTNRHPMMHSSQRSSDSHPQSWLLKMERSLMLQVKLLPTTSQVLVRYHRCLIFQRHPT